MTVNELIDMFERQPSDRPLILGECFQHRPRDEAAWVWTIPPAPFRLFKAKRLRCWIKTDRVILTNAWGRTELSRREVASVLGWIAASWLSAGVSLVMQTGRKLMVVRLRNLAAALDLTYDGLDLD